MTTRAEQSMTHAMEFFNEAVQAAIDEATEELRTNIAETIRESYIDLEGDHDDQIEQLTEHHAKIAEGNAS